MLSKLKPNRSGAILALAICAVSPAAAQPVPQAPEPAPVKLRPDRMPLPTIEENIRTTGCGTLQFNVVFEGAIRSSAPPLPLKIWLNDSLGESAPKVRAYLSQFDWVQISPDADYELTTLVDYPDTMVLIDPKGDMVNWRATRRPGEAGCGILMPRQSMIGSVDSDNWQKLLKVRLEEESRALNILAAKRNVEIGDIVTCLDSDRRRICSDSNRVQHEGDQSVELMRELTALDSMKVSVTNKGKVARHIYFGSIDDSRRIRFLPMRAGDDVAVAPGETVTRDTQLTSVDGTAWFVTMTSQQPVDIGKLDQPGAFGPGVELDGCMERPPSESEVGVPTAPIPSDLGYANSFDLYIAPNRSCPAMGGGDPALFSMAGWMAQIYDTRPFTTLQMKRDADPKNPNQIGLKWLTPAQREHHCGGSMIGPGLVLTAAHCVAANSYAGANEANARRTLRVRTGSIALGGGRSFAIDSIAIHQSYRAGQNQSDIALIKLKAPAGQSLPERTIAVSENSVFAPGTEFETFGWGFSGEWHSGAGNPYVSIAGMRQAPTEELRHGPLTAIKPQNCPVSMRVICAATPPGRARKVFTCFKDSGGPLVRMRDGRQELVGVVNFSKGCSGPVPTVFASVASYGRWIDAAKAWLEKNPGRVGRLGDPALAQ